MNARFFIVSIMLFFLGACSAPQGEPGPRILEISAGESRTLYLPEKLANYANPKIPDFFYEESEGFHGQIALMKSDNTPVDNAISDAGATLGRVLFYDETLSKNRSVSCGTCHRPSRGFSDPRTLSRGFEGGRTRRHSMGLTNARFYKKGHFFWDQRATTLEDQVLTPIQDPIEMGLSRTELVDRVNAGKFYPELFVAAFGDDAITTDRISKALSQFVRSMISTTSKYDLGRAQVSKRIDPFPNFTTEENLGKKLFSTPVPRGGFGCFACHQGEGFIAEEATSNGLDLDISDDKGYGQIAREEKREGHFKVPSLKNVALRAPFMHDGRFSTLEEVLEHYSSGVKASPNLRPPLSMFPRKDFKMSGEQQSAIIAFLKTLTDEEMVRDPKFSDPFEKP